MASNRQMNTRNVTFTPTTGTGTTMTGVTAAGIDAGGSLQKFAGDGDLFPTTIVHDFSDPSITMTVASFSAAYGVGVGSRGTLTLTIKDARNQSAGSGSGDVTYVVTTAVCMNIAFADSFRQFGTANLTFAAESIDGVTSPVSATFAP